MTDVFDDAAGPGVVINGTETVRAGKVIVAPGRKGFSFLQQVMERMGIAYVDNVVDVGIRLETTVNNYPIVNDYYDPKFLFPDGVRTFCTNSGHARVVLERYQGFSLVNGHALSEEQAGNNLVNFALLKTIGLKDPVRSGQQMAVFLGRLANEIGGGKPLMQRVGDFRMGKRSTAETFNEDLYCVPPQLPGHGRRPGACRAGQDHAPHLGGPEEARHHRPRHPPPEHHHVLPGDQDVRQQARLSGPPFPGEQERLHGRRRRRHLARHNRRLGQRDQGCGRDTAKPG